MGGSCSGRTASKANPPLRTRQAEYAEGPNRGSAVTPNNAGHKADHRAGQAGAWRSGLTEATKSAGHMEVPEIVGQWLQRTLASRSPENTGLAEALRYSKQLSR